MRIIIALLLLTLCARVPAAEAQITPADVPAILNLIVANIDDELRRQDSRAVEEGISVDVASLPTFQKLLPDLTALPSRGPGYRVGSAFENTGGAMLTIKFMEPGKNPGEHIVRVDPTLQGRRGNTVIFTITKKDGERRTRSGRVSSFFSELETPRNCSVVSHSYVPAVPAPETRA